MRVVVIGGGFAGLAAAVALADAGKRVTVLEAKNGLGGRARSFLDPATGEVVDNGQHLFLAGYRQTLRFLDRLGTRRHILFQERLNVSFVEPGGKIATLDCPALAAPWHLWIGVGRLSTLSLSDKLAFRRVAREVSRAEDDNLETVEQWLTRLGQSARSRAAFWYPLAIATLNENPSVASAAGLKSVLKVMLAGGWQEARLGISSVGLSDLYTEAARRIIEEKGGQVRVNSPVAQVQVDGDRVTHVRLASGEKVEADAVVASVPPSILARILPEDLRRRDSALSQLDKFVSSPIVSVNLWLDRAGMEPFICGRSAPLFVGLIGTRFQWLFNKAAILKDRGHNKSIVSPVSYVSLIMSAAHGCIDLANEKLVAIAWEEMSGCFPGIRGAQILRSQVVREREATVSLTAGLERLRPGPRTGLANFFLAGDWTATGLPATIESAVASGARAADALL